jgi:hypothetical protein
MKTTLSLLLCFSFALIAENGFSNNLSIAGQIHDHSDKALVSATVTLLKAKDSSLVKVMLTDENGNFLFENLSPGIFLVSATKKDYAKIYRGPFDTEDGEKNSSLSFAMNASINTEDANPLLIQTADKEILTLEGTEIHLKGTAWEMAKAAPGVNENDLGILSIDGDAKFQVKIDGKNSDLTGNSLKIKLQGIKAEEVSAVEIIHAPTGTILNLVTIAGTHQGFYGSTNNSVTFGRTIKNDQSFQFMYAKNKINVYGKYDYSDNSNIDKVTLSRTFPYDGMNLDFNLESITVTKPQTHTAQLGFDYTGKKGFAFGGEINADKMHDHGSVTDNYKFAFEGIDTTFTMQDLYQTQSRENFAGGNIHASQAIGQNGAKISTQFDLLHSLSNWNETLPYQSADGTTYRFNSANNLNQYAGEINYLQPISKNFIALAGFKKSYTNNKSVFSFENLDNSNWVSDPEAERIFNYNAVNNIAYFLTQTTFNKLQINTGVQFTKMVSTGFAPALNETRHKTDSRISPSLTVKQQLTKNNLLTYSLSQKIDRPSYSELNPYGHYISQNKYETGNPLLKPEITNSGKITWTIFQLLSIAGGTDFMKNGMQNVTHIDSTGTSYQQLENLSSSQKSFLEINCLLPIGKNLIIQNKVCWSKTHFESVLYGTEINNRSKAFTGSTQILVSLPRDFSILVTGFYASPTGNGIMHTNAMGTVSAGMSKSFMEKRLEVNVNVNDIFNTGSITADFLTADGDVKYVSKPDSQSVSVSAKYAFGNEKVGQKLKEKSENDDEDK